MLSHPVLSQLHHNIASRKNYLCVGLDPDPLKMPDHIDRSFNGIEIFLSEVIEATVDVCIAYKPNISFFEALGIDGLRLLERIRKRIPANVPVILDAKRGDIGNTSAKQASFLFDVFGADASTLHPYMGEDSVSPFLDYKDKLHFVLGLTSNPGSSTFEKLRLDNGRFLYEQVIHQCNEWQSSYQNLGLVIGGTHSELSQVRSQTELPFLIPGVGAQGGSYQEVIQHGINTSGIALVNVSRGILYADSSPNYVETIKKSLTSYLVG